jgi:hypothetical protein
MNCMFVMPYRPTVWNSALSAQIRGEIMRGSTIDTWPNTGMGVAAENPAWSAREETTAGVNAPAAALDVQILYEDPEAPRAPLRILHTYPRMLDAGRGDPWARVFLWA